MENNKTGIKGERAINGVRYFINILFLFVSVSVVGQSLTDTAENKETDDIHFLQIVERNGEELPEMQIEEVNIVAPILSTKNKSDENSRRAERKSNAVAREYERLVYNIKRVYPFSQIVKERLAMVNDTLAKIETESGRRAYIKQFEKDIFNEFEGEVRSMTISQGRILIKLIDRETRNTSYQLIKEYRGSISAFFWQGIARIFGNNLKDTYDAQGEDILIEIVVRDIEMGWL